MKYKGEYLDRIRSDVEYFKIYFEKVLKIDLVQKGPNKYIAKCCIHTENTPSFVVHNQYGDWYYKCFGCGHSGNIFRLIDEMNPHIGKRYNRGQDHYREDEARKFRAIVQYIEQNIKNTRT